MIEKKVENKTEETTKKMPIATGNSYGVSTAIWENINDNGIKYNTISIQVSTKQKDETYKNRKILFSSDLENLITSLTELKTNADETEIQTGFVKKN